MIDVAWLTSAERDVIRAALDGYIAKQRSTQEGTRDKNVKAIAHWREYVAVDLVTQLRSK